MKQFLRTHLPLFRFLILLLPSLGGAGAGPLYAQKLGQALVDSLEQQLGKKNLSDSNRVDIMTSLCYQYREIAPNKGIEYGLKAEKLAQRINYYYKIGEIYLCLSSCFNFYNDNFKAYEYSLEAVKYNLKYNNNNVLLISEINSYYDNPNNTKEHLKVLYDSILLKLNICTDAVWYIRTIGSLGNSYKEIGEFTKSDSLINIALAEARKLNKKFEIFINLARIASTFYHKKEYDTAIVLLRSVDSFLVSIGDQRILSEMESVLAKCYFESYKLNRAPLKLTEAKKHIAISNVIARKIGYVVHELYIYSTWKDIAKEEGNMDSAFFYLQQYVAIYDSLYGQNARSRFEKIAISQRDEIAAKELRIKDVELQKQKAIIFSSIALTLLFSVSSVMIFRNYRKLSLEKQRSEALLLNILPFEVAEELKNKGTADAKHFDNVTVLFTDFVNFTQVSERMSPVLLVGELDTCFKAFDDIISKYSVEKIKTIGDAYLAVCGLPAADPEHAENAVRAAIEINAFIQDRIAKLGDSTFDIRIGIHSGSVVAGIVGAKKFAYDIWGDTVNTAARMEQNSKPGKINISATTYELVKDKFTCEYRGEIEAKGKGQLKMYYVVSRSFSEG